MQRKTFRTMVCPIARGLDRVGEWWSILILRDAFSGMTRFEQFQKSLGIAPGMLGGKGSLYVTRQTLFTHIATRESCQQIADDLFEAVTSGKVKIRIDQRYPLEQVQQAHRDLEARKTTGSTVLTL